MLAIAVSAWLVCLTRRAEKPSCWQCVKYYGLAMSNTRLAGALANRCVRAYVHKQTNTGTETSRYRDIHTKQQTDRQTNRETGNKEHDETKRHRDRDAEKQTVRERQREIQTERKTERQTSKETERQSV